MRPSARYAALIELLEQIEDAVIARGYPADVLVNSYFRARRYAGSKDRRAISELVYGVLRDRERLLWAQGQVDAEVTARSLVITYVTLNDPKALGMFMGEDQYGPTPFDEAEKSFVTALQALDILAAPATVKANLPRWAAAGFEARYGDKSVEAAAALNCQAPLDLRVNTLKANPEFRSEVKHETTQFEITAYSPLALRSHKHVGLGGIAEYELGQLEVQDEAAQLASLLVDAEPGMQVVDLCAGAGGKSLAVAAKMENSGQLYAFDISAKRLRECHKRADRAGAHNIQISQLPGQAAERKAKLAELAGLCDRAYVDVPCSGTGTWRRSPDQRWRWDEGELAALNETQLGLLREAAELLKLGGRLIYMSCSLLPAENEDIIREFLASSKGWTLLNYRDIWKKVIGGPAPVSDALMPQALQLSPMHHQTDGFFVAVLERT